METQKIFIAIPENGSYPIAAATSINRLFELMDEFCGATEFYNHQGKRSFVGLEDGLDGYFGTITYEVADILAEEEGKTINETFLMFEKPIDSL